MCGGRQRPLALFCPDNPPVVQRDREYRQNTDKRERDLYIRNIYKRYIRDIPEIYQRIDNSSAHTVLSSVRCCTPESHAPPQRTSFLPSRLTSSGVYFVGLLGLYFYGCWVAFSSSLLSCDMPVLDVLDVLLDGRSRYVSHSYLSTVLVTTTAAASSFSSSSSIATPPPRDRRRRD